MIIIINFLSGLVREEVQLPHQVLLSSHSLLSRKLLFWKGPILGNKDLAFGSVVEGIPNALGYSMKMHFSALGSNLSDISVTSPNFKKRQLRFLAKP
jgi:hypothetical protein